MARMGIPEVASGEGGGVSGVRLQHRQEPVSPYFDSRASKRDGMAGRRL